MTWMALIMGLPLLGLVLFWLYPWQVALLPYLVLAGVSGFFDWLMMRAMRLPVRGGSEGMIGSAATVLTWEGDSGRVMWNGEIWRAEAQGGQPFSKGERVLVDDVSLLTLTVRSAGPEIHTHGHHR